MPAAVISQVSYGHFLLTTENDARKQTVHVFDASLKKVFEGDTGSCQKFAKAAELNAIAIENREIASGLLSEVSPKPKNDK